jgi:hypothetical protein
LGRGLRWGEGYAPQGGPGEGERKHISRKYLVVKEKIPGLGDGRSNTFLLCM